MRYELEKYKGPSSRHTCPSCGEKKQFTLFIDTETGELMPPPFGRCNREIKCGHFLKPDQDPTQYQTLKPMQPAEEKTDYMARSIYEPTIGHYRKNSLFAFVASIYGEAEACKAFARYRVGTSKQWGGSPIFWQFDEVGRCRAGKVMGYDKETGKRVKHPHPQITWVHSLLKIEPFHMKGCLFGLHLANEDGHKSICIVESEKSAILCSIAAPQHIWMATGGLQNLVYSKLYPLRKRRVFLYPDLGAYDKWAERAGNINMDLALDTTIETLVGDMPEGFDMGDLFTTRIEAGNVINKHGYPASWDLTA